MARARGVGWAVAAALATVAATAVRRRFPWVPPLYVAAVVLLPYGGWRAWRWRGAGWVRRAIGVAVAGLALVALCPVPWMRAATGDPPGSAWRLDGRLTIDGATVDPPGAWYWLTVGRPPLVGELVLAWLRGADEEPTDMAGGRRAQRPSVAEPAAAAVGLAAAGWPIDFGVVVELSEPVADWLPSSAVLASINGIDVTSRAVFDDLLGGLAAHNAFTTLGGERIEFDGAALPYGRIDVVDRPAGPLEVRVGGPLADTPIGSWYRDLALGSSHGLMVALVSYAYASGEDLAQGRAVAGTGRIRGDGVVGRVGGLRAKATAAREVGADVLLFPALQAEDLEGFEPGRMRLVPVVSLSEAITALRGG
jgi:PDZ domain-containing secreted protein